MFNLQTILTIIAGGVGSIGALIAIWGGVQIGLTIGPSASGGGAGLGPGIAGVVGGAIIIACGVGIASIDTSWASF